MNGKEYCSVNERKKRQATDVAVKFDKAYLNFSREIGDIIKMVVRITGNRTDGKIFDKSYKKHLIPFNALFKSWYKGQQKNPHLSESDESVNEGGMGILTSDQADILQGIVLRNKNKNLKGILNVALKSGHFKGVDKKELLGYIDGARQFVRYMGRTGNESVNETQKRDYKAEYKKFQSSDKAKKYRAELNQYNRKKGTYGNNDGKDASHKGGKISGFEKESTNRGRREKSRLKKESILNESKYKKTYRSITARDKDYLRIWGPVGGHPRVKVVTWSEVEKTGRMKTAYIEVEGEKDWVDAYKKIAFNGRGDFGDVVKHVREKTGDSNARTGDELKEFSGDQGINVYLGGIVSALHKAGLKPKTAKQMKHGFSKSRDKIGFFIEVLDRKREKYTLQLEIDRDGYLWYLSAPKDIKIGKWADTSQLVRGFKKIDRLPGFGQDAIFKRRR